MGLFDWLTGNVDPNSIGKYYDGIEDIDTSFQQNTGEQMFNPNSQYNRTQLGSMRQGMYDQMAMQGNMTARQAAMGQKFGANQRQQASNAQAGNALYQGFNQHMGQAAGIGSGMLGQAMQGNMSNQNVALQRSGAMASQASQNAQNTAGLWQGMIGAGIGGLSQGLISNLGNNVTGGAGNVGSYLGSGNTNMMNSGYQHSFNTQFPSNPFGR